MTNAPRLPIRPTGWLLALVFLYLCLGNLPRMFPLPGFRDSLAITEFGVYLALPLGAALQGRLLSSMRPLVPILVIIWLSTAWGAILYGFDLKALMYAVRLGLQLVSAVLAGQLLFQAFGADTRRAYRYLLGIYGALLAFGGFLFAAFPDSRVLWAFLGRFGVTWVGDPHINRFYSTYFDPNFYAAIAILPLLIALTLNRQHKRPLYQGAIGLILLSIILSGSRSGIASAVLMLGILYARKLGFLYTLKVSKRAIRSSIAALVGILALSPLYWPSLTRLIDRMAAMQGDNSALQRLRSFQYGLAVFSDHPLLGVGYNYLSFRMARDVGAQAVDSSVMVMAANFGLLLTWLLFVLLGLWVVNTWRKLPALDRADAPSADLFRYLVAYMAICIVFACQFNNLLFYQFWLFPMVMLGAYFTRLMTHLTKKDLGPGGAANG